MSQALGRDVGASGQPERPGPPRSFGEWRAALEQLVAWVQATAPVAFVIRYSDDNLPNWAAAVAYHAFFSLFPILLSLWTLVGVVLQDETRLAVIANAVHQLLPAEAAQQLVAVLQSTRDNTGAFGIISTLLLIYSGSALFGSLETAFNGLYRVHGREFLQQKLMGIGMLLLFALLLVLSLVAASVAEAALVLSHHAADAWLPAGPWQEWLVSVGSHINRLGWLLPGGWAFFFFLTIYFVVPNCRLSLGQVWPGAAVAAGLFVLISQVFPIYLHFVSLDRYGVVFALAPLLLTWFYFLAHSMLIGAAINAYYRGPQQTPSR